MPPQDGILPLADQIILEPPTYDGIKDSVLSNQFLFGSHKPSPEMLRQHTELRTKFEQAYDDLKEKTPPTQADFSERVNALYVTYLLESTDLISPLVTDNFADYVTDPLPGETFIRQGFLGKEMNGQPVNSCVIASTLNALTALGIPLNNLGGASQIEKEFIETVVQYPQELRDTLFDSRTGNFTQGAPIVMVEYLLDKHFVNAKAQGNSFALYDMMIDLAKGNALVFGRGYERVLVGYAKPEIIVGKHSLLDYSIYYIDPLDNPPKPTPITIRKAIQQGFFNFADSAYIRIRELTSPTQQMEVPDFNVGADTAHDADSPGLRITREDVPIEQSEKPALIITPETISKEPQRGVLKLTPEDIEGSSSNAAPLKVTHGDVAREDLKRLSREISRLFIPDELAILIRRLIK